MRFAVIYTLQYEIYAESASSEDLVDESLVNDGEIADTPVSIDGSFVSIVDGDRDSVATGQLMMKSLMYIPYTDHGNTHDLMSDVVDELISAHRHAHVPRLPLPEDEVTSSDDTNTSSEQVVGCYNQCTVMSIVGVVAAQRHAARVGEREEDG